MLSTVKCCFEKPIEFFPTTSQNNFTQDPKNLKKHIFFKKKPLLIEMFLWTRRMQVWHTAENFSTEGQNVSLNV